jgi:hypothetical protein
VRVKKYRRQHKDDVMTKPEKSKKCKVVIQKWKMVQFFMCVMKPYMYINKQVFENIVEKPAAQTFSMG